jgi:hypothetical protein
MAGVRKHGGRNEEKKRSRKKTEIKKRHNGG